jgi:hypothetical protein
VGSYSLSLDECTLSLDECILYLDECQSGPGVVEGDGLGVEGDGLGVEEGRAKSRKMGKGFKKASSTSMPKFVRSSVN